MGPLLGCSLVALLLAGSGMGARPVETTVQDDATLLHRSDAEVRDAVSTLVALGADRVRVTAGWSVLAPGARESSRPGPPFDPRDSRTYPEPGFAALDRAVREAEAAGLQAQIDLAFWAPRWAVAAPSSNPDRERVAPDPQAFADFAAAVAARYSGRGADHRGAPLPEVDLWTTWNEPNHPSFLSPQWKRTDDGGWRPASPHVYRAMHEAAYDELKAVSPANAVLVGGLSSFGSRVPGEGGVPPLAFLRALACADDALRPLDVAECRRARPVRADGFSYHPYSPDVTPGTSAPHPDDAFVADLDRLAVLLSDLRAKGRIDGDWPLFLTEYGYESDPPDPTATFSAQQQAHFLGWAAALARAQPRVRMFPQFLLRDIDPADSGFPVGSQRRWRDWQSGLLLHDGRPKPAAQAFKLPLHAFYVAGGALGLAGEVRPGAGPHVVRVERRDLGAAAWRPVATDGIACAPGGAEFVTDGAGAFERLAAWEGPGDYRLVWRRPGGAEEAGPAVPVGQPVLAAR